MPASLLKQCLRANAEPQDQWSPDGWSPCLRVTVMGPTPAAAEVVWKMSKPDGSEWFERRVDVPELEDEATWAETLRYNEEAVDITEVGDCSFTLTLVSELEDVEQVLHQGVLRARRDGDEQWTVGVDWLLPLALVGLDTHDERDAPKLRVTVFLGGEVDPYTVEAHIFHDGKKRGQASYTSGGWQFTDTKSVSVAHEVIAEFDEIRGWNNLEGWNEQWHRLDQHPGHYDVKFVRDKKVVRIVGFDVADGRIVKTGHIEPDEAGRPMLFVTAEVKGALDGDFDKKAIDNDAFYGDGETAAVDWSSDGMYWYWAGRTAVEEGDAGAGGAPVLDDETAEALESLVSKAGTLVRFWEDDMRAGIDKSEPSSYQSDFLTQCELVVSDVDAWEAARSKLDVVGDDYPVELDDGETTLGKAAARVLKLRELARNNLDTAAQDDADALAPYRALLRNDKLAIFEDHPANEFRYYTTNKKVIETPEELAEATFWYFEGRSDIQSSGEVEGHKVKVAVEGWRVLGYQFDEDHAIVDEYEEQGAGANAPKKAFKH